MEVCAWPVEAVHAGEKVKLERLESTPDPWLDRWVVLP